MLAKGRCALVIADTLPYECCTSRDPDRWIHAQRKLMQCPHSVEVWTHTGEILRAEIQSAAPASTRVDQPLTEQTRKWFKTQQTYVPDDLRVLGQ